MHCGGSVRRGNTKDAADGGSRRSSASLHPGGTAPYCPLPAGSSTPPGPAAEDAEPVDRAPGGWQQPASPLAAGLLNVLPGGGNFYLASGNAADSSHWVYGMVNLLFWPISILWGVPEATIDAGNINKREMLNFYKYGNGGIPDFPGLEAAGRRTMPQQRVAPRQVPYRTQETAPRQVPYRNRYHQAPRGYYNNYQTYGY